MASTKATKIGQLNDAFRRGDPSVPGQRFVTAGVIQLLKRNKIDGFEICSIVENFDNFTAPNDPHGEHDFGSFEYRGETVFWKIDVYGASFKTTADDPTDLENSQRILTILLADEW